MPASTTPEEGLAPTAYAFIPAQEGRPESRARPRKTPRPLVLAAPRAGFLRKSLINGSAPDAAVRRRQEGCRRALLPTPLEGRPSQSHRRHTRSAEGETAAESTRPALAIKGDDSIPPCFVLRPYGISAGKTFPPLSTIGQAVPTKKENSLTGQDVRMPLLSRKASDSLDYFNF